MSDRIILVLSGEVTLDDFSIAISKLKGLVYALSKEVAMGAEIEWIIEELSTSDATTIVRGVGSEEEVGSVVKAYEKVGKALQEQEEIPFSPAVIDEANGLVNILNERVRSIRFETDDMEALILSAPAYRVEEERVSVESYGAIEGRIHTLSSRRGLRFMLYDLLYDVRVACYLQPGQEQEEIMRDAWDKIAIVEGWVRRDPITGHPLTIRRISKVGTIEEGDRGDYKKARGILPLDPENMPEDVIRRLRDG